MVLVRKITFVVRCYYGFSIECRIKPRLLRAGYSVIDQGLQHRRSIIIQNSVISKALSMVGLIHIIVVRHILYKKRSLNDEVIKKSDTSNLSLSYPETTVRARFGDLSRRLQEFFYRYILHIIFETELDAIFISLSCFNVVDEKSLPFLISSSCNQMVCDFPVHFVIH